MYNKHVADKAKQSRAVKQQTMSTFLSGAKKPKLKDYPTAAAKWIVNTYGTLSSVEDPSFREMILTLNADAPNLSNKRMLDVVHQMNDYCSGSEQEKKGQRCC